MLFYLLESRCKLALMDTRLIVGIALGALLLLAVLSIVIIRAKAGSKKELPQGGQQGRSALESDQSAPIDASVVDYDHVPSLDGAAKEASSSASAYETPESVPSRIQRLRSRLAKSGGLGKALLGILSRSDLSAADWEELEDTLLMADVGLDSTSRIMERLREEAKIQGTSDPQVIRNVLREELLKLVDPSMDRSLKLASPSASDAENAADTADADAAPNADAADTEHTPDVILMVGVNGTGKTTTAGKLARLLVAENHSVLLGAADTFRAAAADQLETWGQRVGVRVVRSEREGADPASVAFEAVTEAAKQGSGVVIVDTAGRLQNKAGLMDELGKIKRVIEKKAPVSEVLLVLDATTGQNGMQQAKVFAEVTGLTGIVLTKLDGTAKGGIVISVQRELGVPVKFVGLGEGADDLAPFDPEAFVDSLLA